MSVEIISQYGEHSLRLTPVKIIYYVTKLINFKQLFYKIKRMN